MTYCNTFPLESLLYWCTAVSYGDVRLAVSNAVLKHKRMVLTCDGSLGFQDTFLFLAINFKSTYSIFRAAQLVQICLTLRPDVEQSICREPMQRCKGCLEV